MSEEPSARGPATAPWETPATGAVTADVALAAQCAATTVLITAASDEVIEHLARGIHAASARAARPFGLVAAATLPIDAGLIARCAELLEAVDGGSLLLTGVEHMPAGVQDNVIEAFDTLDTATSDRARLMVGSSTNLYQRVLDGLFSARLFYRLNVIHIDSRPDRHPWDSSSRAPSASSAMAF